MKFVSAFLCGMMLALAAYRLDEGQPDIAYVNLAFAALWAGWYVAYSRKGEGK